MNRTLFTAISDTPFQIANPATSREEFIRSCLPIIPSVSMSGNIHVGFKWANEAPKNRANVASVFNIAGTLPAVLIDPDSRRYGRGNCRIARVVSRGDPYDGVELMTLSDFWMQDEELIGWAYDCITDTFERYDELLAVHQDPVMFKKIQCAIHTTDKPTAQALCNELKVGWF